MINHLVLLNFRKTMDIHGPWVPLPFQSPVNHRNPYLIEEAEASSKITPRNRKIHGVLDACWDSCMCIYIYTYIYIIWMIIYIYIYKYIYIHTYNIYWDILFIYVYMTTPSYSIWKLNKSSCEFDVFSLIWSTLCAAWSLILSLQGIQIVVEMAEVRTVFVVRGKVQVVVPGWKRGDEPPCSSSSESVAAWVSTGSKSPSRPGRVSLQMNPAIQAMDPKQLLLNMPGAVEMLWFMIWNITWSSWNKQQNADNDCNVQFEASGAVPVAHLERVSVQWFLRISRRAKNK